MNDYAKRYNQAIIQGRITADKEVKRQSRLDLIERKKSRLKDYPYYFDKNVAKDFINLAKIISPHKLALFQLAILQQLNSWRLKSNPNIRRYSESLITMARKNAKSYLASIQLVTLLIQYELSDQHDKQLYIVATRLSQARLTLNTCKALIERLQPSSEIARHFKLNQNIIYSKMTGSYIQAIPAQTDLNGYNPSFINIDEVEGLKSDKVIQVMKSALGLSGGSIMMTSTAGFNMDSPVKALWDTGESALKDKDLYSRGLYYIYTQDNRKEILDNPKSWLKSNPLLSVKAAVKTMKPYLKDQLHSASVMNTLNSTITKNFNRFGNVTNSGFISLDQWNQNKVKPINLYGLKNVILGVDLSHSRDLTSVSLLTNYKDNQIYADTISFIPTGQLNIQTKSKRDGIDFLKLEDQGYCKVCRNDYGFVPTDLVPNYIKKLVKKYHWQTPVTVAFDHWSGDQLTTELGHDKRFKMIDIRQYPSVLSPGIIYLYKLIASHKLVHNDNPLFNYGFHNLKVVKTFTGLPFFQKQHNVDKIDNIASLLDSIVAYRAIKPKQQDDRPSLNDKLNKNKFIM